MKKLLPIILFFFGISLLAVDNFAGNCLDFDGAIGSDNYISVPHNTSLNLTTSLTFECWVKFNQVTRTTDDYDWQCLFTKNSYQRAYGMMLLTEGPDKLLRFYHAGSTPNTSDYNWADVQPDVWYHVAVTYNGSATKHYINGQQVSTTAVTGSIDQNTYNLVIGMSNNGTNYPLDGELEEVRLWNTSRTQAQIQDNMYATLGGTETGLVSYWQFNESTGTTASDGIGPNDGTLNNMADNDWITSTVPNGIVSITTTTATSITQTTATSGGEVTIEDGVVITSQGVCWSTSLNPTTADNFTTDGTGTGTFTSSITGLTASTTYHYRAYATNSFGTSYGDEYTFSTLDIATPTVTTTIAALITQTTASSGGEVTNDGGAAVTSRGVCWSTNPNPTTADNYTTDGTGTGVFTSNITGLSASTEYYYRAYAANSVGVSYGDEYSFSTSPMGSGTEVDPYQISNLNDLRRLSENSEYWDAHFVQTADIDATDTQNWNGGEGFSPIGNVSDSFTGNYNGQGYEIDGLYINRYNSDNQGLFGFTDNTDISNLSVTNVDINGGENVGGLAGGTYSSAVMNCCCSGRVLGDWCVGGLVGENSSSTITNSYSTGLVVGNFVGGGLVGYNEDSTITNSYSTGNVSGGLFADGLWVGGLVGYNSGNSTVSNSYSTGWVSGYDYVGGLVGYNSASVNNSFWDTETGGQSTSSGGTGKTTAEMKDMATFTDVATAGLTTPWDFLGTPNDDVNTEDIWGINGLDNGGYLFLMWQGYSVVPNIPVNIEISVSGSAITISWDAVTGATSYRVYSSSNPYGTFSEDISGTFTGESWTAPTGTAMKYYCVKAVN